MSSGCHAGADWQRRCRFDPAGDRFDAITGTLRPGPPNSNYECCGREIGPGNGRSRHALYPLSYHQLVKGSRTLVLTITDNRNTPARNTSFTLRARRMEQQANYALFSSRDVQ
jgi:hypothetical protein